MRSSNSPLNYQSIFQMWTVKINLTKISLWFIFSCWSNGMFELRLWSFEVRNVLFIVSILWIRQTLIRSYYPHLHILHYLESGKFYDLKSLWNNYIHSNIKGNNFIIYVLNINLLKNTNKALTLLKNVFYKKYNSMYKV